MNYKKHHDKIIERAQARTIEGYCELHHIIPRCMGGTNDSSNIVALTADEHYVIHQLLAKMHPKNRRLQFAVKAMAMSTQGNRPKNKLYKWVREKHAQAVSDHMRGIPKSKEHKKKLSEANKGKQPWNTGVVRGPTNEATKQKLSASLSGKTPWNKGKKMPSITGMNNPTKSPITRQKMSTSARNRKRIRCPHCNILATVNMINRWHNDNCKRIRM